MSQPLATLPSTRDAVAARRGRSLRRIGIAALCLLVVAALAGLLGPRAATATASGDGYDLTVRHGQITRPGLPVPLEITVERAGGFDGPVTLSVSRDLLDRLDFNNWTPNPDGEAAGPDRVEYEFTEPRGDVLHVLLDARTAPGQLPGLGRYTVAVAGPGGEPPVEVAFRMAVLP